MDIIQGNDKKKSMFIELIIFEKYYHQFSRQTEKEKENDHVS
jgi:hypothetical protein